MIIDIEYSLTNAGACMSYNQNKHRLTIELIRGQSFQSPESTLTYISRLINKRSSLFVSHCIITIS